MRPDIIIIIWANEPDLYTIGFVSPSGEQIERVPLVLGKETEITFALDATKIALTYQTYESSSGSQLIFLRFETPSPGIWHIRVYPVLYRKIHLLLLEPSFSDLIRIRRSPIPETGRCL